LVDRLESNQCLRVSPALAMSCDPASLVRRNTESAERTAPVGVSIPNTGAERRSAVICESGVLGKQKDRDLSRDRKAAPRARRDAGCFKIGASFNAIALHCDRASLDRRFARAKRTLARTSE